MIRTLLVDDHEIVRNGLQILLENQDNIKVVGEASNGVEAIDQLRQKKIDIIIMDINMPKMDGLEATKLITKDYPETKVIALSMYKEISILEKMIQNGAKGYLLKSCSQDELLKAINNVYNNEEYISDYLKPAYNSQLTSNKEKASNTPRISKREKEILQLISEENTTAQIAKELFLSVATVETHRKNLLRKLSLKNTAGLMRFAFENSLVS